MPDHRQTWTTTQRLCEGGRRVESSDGSAAGRSIQQVCVVLLEGDQGEEQRDRSSEVARPKRVYTLFLCTKQGAYTKRRDDVEKQ